MSERGTTDEKKKRFLSREQQAILRRDHRESMRGKSQQEKQAARENTRSQREAMSESERAELVRLLRKLTLAMKR